MCSPCFSASSSAVYLWNPERRGRFGLAWRDVEGDWRLADVELHRGQSALDSLGFKGPFSQPSLVDGRVYAVDEQPGAFRIVEVLPPEP